MKRRKDGSQMGEVRVRVKLTNAADEALVRRGQLAPDRVHVYEAGSARVQGEEPGSRA